jgi:hypothetical protein
MILRQVLTLIGLALLLITQPGCQLFGGFGKKETPIPVAFSRTPTQQELLQTIATRNTQFRQLSSNVRISLDGIPKLRGTMQMELPRRLRVKAGVMGVSQFGVDVGSNDEHFWVWTKVNLPNQPPAIFHATHEGFKKNQSAVRQSIPLEPVWLFEGLGLIQFESTDVHQGPFATPEGFLKLYTTRKTGTGRTIRVTTFHPQQGIILQQALYGDRNELIAYTDSLDYKSWPERNISLPQKIEMHLFQNGQEAGKMVIEASDYEFDSLYGNPAQMWSLPQPQGVQSIDLLQPR